MIKHFNHVYPTTKHRLSDNSFIEISFNEAKNDNETALIVNFQRYSHTHTTQYNKSEQKKKPSLTHCTKC